MIIIYTDATYSAKDGRAVIGWCDQLIQLKAHKVIVATDNNDAEFKAIEFALEQNGLSVSVRSDSESAIRQAKERWPDLDIKHVSRYENVADIYVNAINEDIHRVSYTNKLLKRFDK